MRHAHRLGAQAALHAVTSGRQKDGYAVCTHEGCGSPCIRHAWAMDHVKQEHTFTTAFPSRGGAGGAGGQADGVRAMPSSTQLAPVLCALHSADAINCRALHRVRFQQPATRERCWQPACVRICQMSWECTAQPCAEVLPHSDVQATDHLKLLQLVQSSGFAVYQAAESCQATTTQLPARVQPRLCTNSTSLSG
jgi:hypothetical protein